MVMTTPQSAREQSAAERPFRRRLEIVLAAIGLGASAVLQGGFALVITRSDENTLRESLLPVLGGAGLDIADADETLNTLAAWFGFSLILVALLTVIGIFFARTHPRRRSTGWWFLAAGVFCLFGTQMLLYPVAFFFFLTAALFAVRTPTPRRPS